MDWLTWLLFGEHWPSGASVHEVSWSLRAVPSLWWFLPLLVLSLMGVVWFYRQEKLSRAARISLFTLRAITLLALGILVCRPTLEATLQVQRQRPIVVLLDNSLSMSLSDPRPTAADKLRLALLTRLRSFAQGIPPDASLSQVPEQTPETLSRVEMIRLALTHPELKLLERLAKQGPVQIKLFGQGITTAKIAPETSTANPPTSELPGPGVIPGLTASEPRTALGDAMTALISADIAADRPAAIVILSDGLEHGSQVIPENAARKCQELEIPLHCYGIGSTDFASLQLKSVNVPEALFVDDTVSAQASWRASGLEGKPLHLTLMLGDLVVGRRELVGKDGEHITATIPFAVPKNLRADGPVDFRLSLSGPALASGPMPQVELNKRVRLVDRKVRVLVVDHAPRFETKFLMASLLRDRRVEAAFHFTGNDPAGMQNAPFLPLLPATRAELFQYDLIILGDVPPEALGTERLSWLRDLIREGAGLVLVAGKKYTPAAYMTTPLSEVIPIESASTMPAFDDSLKTEAYAIAPTPAAKRHPMLALAEEAEANERLWNELPGFYSVFPALKLRPGALALLNHPEKKIATGPLPVMAMQHYGRGQVLYLGTDELWRWRANVGDKLHSRIWGQIVYQLGLPRLMGGARRVQFALEQSEQWVGRLGFVYVRAYDHDFQPLRDAQLQAKIIPLDRQGKPSGEPAQPLLLEAILHQPGEYRALLANDKPGRFLLTLDAPEPSQLPFHVDYAPNDERIPAPLAAERLRGLAKETGGSFFREEDLPTLPDHIHGQLGTHHFRHDAVFWNPLILILLTALLAAEWIIRKKSNLS